MVVIQPNSKLEVSLTANNPGLTLFHYQQMHMDYDFTALMKYAG